MKSFKYYLFVLCLIVSASGITNTRDDQRGLLNDFDPGPNPKTRVGQGYINIFSTIPHHRRIGELVYGKNKFRWAFGPIFYRGRTGKNEVKVLVIGQDGNQDSQITDRSFTGGTGARMQHVLNYMGIYDSYFFMNTFSYTIKGQYADYAPHISRWNGNESVRWGSVINEKTFKLAQHPKSPLVTWRNDLLDHIIESNKDSLQLIVVVGGAAKDTLASYIEYKGGTCSSWLKDPKDAQLVEYEPFWTERNMFFFMPLDKQDGFILPDNLVGASEDELRSYIRNRSNQSKYQRLFGEAVFKKELVTRTDGKYGNGFYNLKQSGQDINDCQMNGKDLNNSLNKVIGRDVRFLGFQHPGSIAGGTTAETLEFKFIQSFAPLMKWDRDEGWRITPDTGKLSEVYQKHYEDKGYLYDEDKKLISLVEDYYESKDSEEKEDIKDEIVDRAMFEYSKSEIPRRDFRFGLTESVGGRNTDTQRGSIRDSASGKNYSGAYILFGGKRANLRKSDYLDALFSGDNTLIEIQKHGQLVLSPEYLDGSHLLHESVPWESNRADLNSPSNQFKFDTGPTKRWSQIFTGTHSKVPNIQDIIDANENLPVSEPIHGAKVFYRGRPDSSEILVLSDQYSHDDMWIGRAMMGAEGQRFQNFLDIIDAGNAYTIFRLLPVDMIDASAQDLTDLVNATSAWRDTVWKALLANKKNNKKIKLIIAHGNASSAVIDSLETAGIPVLKMNSSKKSYKDAYLSLKNDAEFSEYKAGKSFKSFSDKLVAIAREDIPYGVRRWVGTAGNRVIRERDGGLVYAAVAPLYAVERESHPLTDEECRALLDLDLIESSSECK